MGKFLVFIGDHGRMMMSGEDQDENKKFASLFLPGEPHLGVEKYDLSRNQSGDMRNFQLQQWMRNIEIKS